MIIAVSILSFIDLFNYGGNNFQAFPDTPLGRIERYMAFNRYRDAYQETGRLIELGNRSIDPKIYRIRAQCALIMLMSEEAIEYSSLVINSRWVAKREKDLCYQIRSKANIQIGKFKEALEDSKHSNDKRTIYEARTVMNLFNEYKSKELSGENGEESLILDILLEAAISSIELKMKRSQLAWDTKDYRRFLEVAKDLTEYNPNDYKLQYHLSVAHVCSGDLNEAYLHLDAAMRYKNVSGDYRDIIWRIYNNYWWVQKTLNSNKTKGVDVTIEKIFEDASKYCRPNSVLFRNVNLMRAKFIRLVGPNQVALEFIDDMIASYSEDADIRIERAEIYLEEGDYEKAILDFKSVLRKGNNHRARQGLEIARRMKREKTTTDYYKILNITRNAGTREIKAAFRRAIIRWHPDKYRDPEAKKEAETMMKKINIAYEILSDPHKKRIFDQGVDPEHLDRDFLNPFDVFDVYRFPSFGKGFNNHKIQPEEDGFQFEFRFG